MYTETNFKTKKELREAVAHGERVVVYYPGIQGSKRSGTVSLEGPHYPKPHAWYAEVEIVEDGNDLVVVNSKGVK